MDKLPSIKPRKLVKILGKQGFYIHHQTGSHLVLKHKIDENIRVTVPVHNKELKPGTLLHILEQAHLSREDFMKLVR